MHIMSDNMTNHIKQFINMKIGSFLVSENG